MILAMDMDIGPIDRLLHGLTGVMNDLRPVWQVIHADFFQIEEVQFGNQGERGGEKWPKLSEPYATRKEKMYPGNPILVASGRMVGSLVATGGEHRFFSEPRQMTVGTAVPYAVFHETGTDKMKPRPPIQITNEDRTQWLGALSKYIERYLKS